MDDDFSKTFRALTGHEPLPWQVTLYERFIADRVDNIPRSCSLPTGLGKTLVIAIWLIALACGKVPRRLVYVVNRRTVVDQTTDEVEKLRRNLDQKPELQRLKECLGELAISTLRGQFADNRAWSADPSRPAVIVGTVDMIGSRLLFSGYGVGFKSKPLHAGFLGQDALLVHDEAHLEPAFQKLIEAIQHEQDRCKEFAKFHVMELTATTRNDNNHDATATFTLGREDHEHSVVKQRIQATKHLYLYKAKDDAKIAHEIAHLALDRRWAKDENGNAKDADAAVLVVVRTLDDVKKVCDKLTDKKSGVGADHVQQLTGTMRGLERDRMADPRRSDASRVFARFLKPPKSDAPESEQWQTEPMPGTVYLVCTSAGEVGIDISADYMVCDLSTFESMAQRFGRVNRYGERTDTRIDVVHPAKFDEKDKLTPARQATLDVLRKLPAIGDDQHDASPLALSDLDASERLAAFAPEPTILPVTDILFDAWALTSVRGKMPGRPDVELYLHGIAEWQPQETHVGWREEVEIVTGDLLNRYPPTDLLDEYPLKPHELLRDRSDRVFKQLEILAEQHADKPIWLVDDHGYVEPATLEQLVDKKRKGRINGCIVLLPPSVGGLNSGMLDGASEQADDVADIPLPHPDARARAWMDDPDDLSKTSDMRRVRTIEVDSGEDEEPQRWEWFERFPEEGGRTAKKPVLWKTHVDDVVARVKKVVAALLLPPEIADAIIVAAELHDHGKCRERFQITLGNHRYPDMLLAKSGRGGARLPEPFRHEFASVLDAQADGRFSALGDEMKDLVLHLIAAHHGRARPHFDLEEAFDPAPTEGVSPDDVAMEVPRRFARLQRKYGRWGLAYLESILRAADWAASAEPSAFLDEKSGGV